MNNNNNNNNNNNSNVMDEIGVDTLYDVSRWYFYSSKLPLIVSKGGVNSADLDALGFF